MSWLFPAWLRQTRGEEAIALVLDLAPPNATSLSAGSRIDLIRAGLHARRVGTPPLGVWSAVTWARRRNRSGMVPDQWHPWLLDGLGRRGFLVRLALLRSIVGMGPFFVLLMAGDGHVSRVRHQLLVGVAVVVGLACLVVVFQGRSWRRELYLKNGYGEDGVRFDDPRIQLDYYLPQVSNLPVEPFGWATALVGVALVGTAGWKRGFSEIALKAPSTRVLVVTLLAMLLLAALVRSSLRRVATNPATTVVAMDGWGNRARVVGVPAAFGLGLWWFSTALPDAAMTMTVGFAMVFLGVAMALSVRMAGRRLQRAVGIWDMFPSLGPLPCLVWRESLDQRPTPPGPGHPAS